MILDEIQECPKAITSLKYFCEDAWELAVAAAGSLLGLAVHSGAGFPVGKVNMPDPHPMSFFEFLEAKGERYLRELVDGGDWQLIGSFSSGFRDQEWMRNLPLYAIGNPGNWI